MKPGVIGVEGMFRVTVPAGIVHEYDQRELQQDPQRRITVPGEYAVTEAELAELISDTEYQANADGAGIEDSPAGTKAMYRRFLEHLRKVRGLSAYERAITGIDELARDRLIAGLRKSQ